MISQHEAKIYEVVKNGIRWLSAADIAQRASVSDRTARLHLPKMVDLGVVDVAKFPHEFLYRIKAQPSTAAGKAYVAEVETALAVLAESKE